MLEEVKARVPGGLEGSREPGGSNERVSSGGIGGGCSEPKRNLRKGGRMKVRHTPGGVPSNQIIVDSSFLYGCIGYNL